METPTIEPTIYQELNQAIVYDLAWSHIKEIADRALSALREKDARIAELEATAGSCVNCRDNPAHYCYNCYSGTNP